MKIIIDTPNTVPKIPRISPIIDFPSKYPSENLDMIANDIANIPNIMLAQPNKQVERDTIPITSDATDPRPSNHG